MRESCGDDSPLCVDVEGGIIGIHFVIIYDEDSLVETNQDRALGEPYTMLKTLWTKLLRGSASHKHSAY